MVSGGGGGSSSGSPGAYAVALAPTGEVWASILLFRSTGWAWALARPDRAGSAVHVVAAVPPAQEDLPPGWSQQSMLLGSSLAFTPSGVPLVATGAGLWRLDGTRWTSLTDMTGGPLRISALSAAPDGTVWGWGASGIIQILVAAAP